MKLLSFLPIVLLVALAGCRTTGDHYHYYYTTEEIPDMHERLAPYIAMARKTYPEAKKKYLSGLAPGDMFLVTIARYPDQANTGFLIIEVDDNKKNISGLVSEKQYGEIWMSPGDRITVSESHIRDWAIVHSDGKEDGNYIGKYLKAYAGGKIGLIIEVKLDAHRRPLSIEVVDALTAQRESVPELVTEDMAGQVDAYFSRLDYSDITWEKVYKVAVYDIRRQAFVKKGEM